MFDLKDTHNSQYNSQSADERHEVMFTFCKHNFCLFTRKLHREPLSHLSRRKITLSGYESTQCQSVSLGLCHVNTIAPKYISGSVEKMLFSPYQTPELWTDTNQ